jgi:DNA polymerase elongation subunit (family B)
MQYALDLETNTEGTLPSGKPKGLDPTGTEITSAAIYYDNGVVSFGDHHEKRLLRSLNEWFMDEASDPGVILTWNGAGFDFPFLHIRSGILDVPLGLRVRPRPGWIAKYTPQGYKGGLLAQWGAHDHVDLMVPYREIAKELGLTYYGLKSMARHFGLDPIEVERTKMELLSRAQLAAYNISDVEVTWKLGALLPPPRNLDDYRDSKIS